MNLDFRSLRNFARSPISGRRPAGYLPSGTVGQWPPVTWQWRTRRDGHHVISVRRHLTKNRPGLPQKSSEKLCNEGEGTQGLLRVLLVPKGRGPKDPAAHCMASRRLQPSTKLLRQLLYSRNHDCAGSEVPCQSNLLTQWNLLLLGTLDFLFYGYSFSSRSLPQTLWCTQAPLVPSRIEGIRTDGGRWLGSQPAVRRASDAVPSSLYSHSQRRCRPQPRGGGRDATSRQDTRQDRWLYFKFQLRVFYWGECLSRVLQPDIGEGPKCRKSGHLAADTTKSFGNLHSLQLTPSHRATCPESSGSWCADKGAACPQSWEFSGDDQFYL